MALAASPSWLSSPGRAPLGTCAHSPIAKWATRSKLTLGDRVRPEVEAVPGIAPTLEADSAVVANTSEGCTVHTPTRPGPRGRTLLPVQLETETWTLRLGSPTTDKPAAAPCTGQTAARSSQATSKGRLSALLIRQLSRLCKHPCAFLCEPCRRLLLCRRSWPPCL